MNAYIAAMVAFELHNDREFALRFYSAANAPAIVAYFVARGIEKTDAQSLALAYMAGVHHATIGFERVIDRAEKTA